MKPHYEFIKTASSNGEIAYHVLRLWGCAPQIWVRAQTRKDWECKITGQPIAKGAWGWRPITNANNRMHRISEAGMERLIEKARSARAREQK